MVRNSDNPQKQAASRPVKTLLTTENRLQEIDALV